MALDMTITKPAAAQTSGQFSTFYVDDLFFGVDVLHVQEVLRSQPMTPVPQAPDVVEGLINLRGQIVTAIDMRRRLQMPRRAGGKPPMNIVVSTTDGAVSLLVDEIGDVLDMDRSTYEQPPNNLDSAARELIQGVYKLKDGLLLVLDTDKAIEVGNCQVSLNSAFEAQSQDAQGAGMRPSSLVSDAPADEQSDCGEPRDSVRKAKKKAPAAKTNGAARTAKAGAA
jgi:purine-binding chemotaxis protein CheW